MPRRVYDVVPVARCRYRWYSIACIYSMQSPVSNGHEDGREEPCGRAGSDGLQSCLRERLAPRRQPLRGDQQQQSSRSSAACVGRDACFCRCRPICDDFARAKAETHPATALQRTLLTCTQPPPVRNQYTPIRARSTCYGRRRPRPHSSTHPPSTILIAATAWTTGAVRAAAASPLERPHPPAWTLLHHEP